MSMREHSLLRTIEKLGIRLSLHLSVMGVFSRNAPEPSPDMFLIG